ncbi:MAG: hypothetical protein JXR31_03545 [Prolixibacteraceae bacterium]|nr:hypothetical protein [Prolixibacteraceae bacterium]
MEPKNPDHVIQNNLNNSVASVILFVLMAFHFYKKEKFKTVIAPDLPNQIFINEQEKIIIQENFLYQEKTNSNHRYKSRYISSNKLNINIIEAGFTLYSESQNTINKFWFYIFYFSGLPANQSKLLQSLFNP